jgi:hypothetical protein
MNVSIEKITNGFVVTIDGVKTFCDVPEAICGLTSEWVLKECEKKTPEQDDMARFVRMAAKQQLQQAAGLAAQPVYWTDNTLDRLA